MSREREYKNRKAFFQYLVLEKVEAGIALIGSEVKSIRDGNLNLSDSYARIDGGQVFLLNCHISEYKNRGYDGHDPQRKRKLLLRRREIKRLIGKIREKGYTLIPTKVLFSEKGKVKVEVSLAKGKRTYEKKRAIKERELEREVRAELKKRLR